MKNTLLVNITYLIKELRMKNNITQECLSEKTGLDRTYISGVERNQRNITIKTLSEIIRGLNISEKDFILLLANKINKDEKDKK
ncbi:helix-turn-helix domain-containing protein [Acinetobacter baumannii]|uniref:helix-turn-helix domain-containing protein n=1 Tax=Acinetobacter baumannii TaxID=470 RepID=UPI0034CD3874